MGHLYHGYFSHNQRVSIQICIEKNTSAWFCTVSISFNGDPRRFARQPHSAWYPRSTRVCTRSPGADSRPGDGCFLGKFQWNSRNISDIYIYMLIRYLINIVYLIWYLSMIVDNCRYDIERVIRPWWTSRCEFHHTTIIELFNDNSKHKVNTCFEKTTHLINERITKFLDGFADQSLSKFWLVANRSISGVEIESHISHIGDNHGLHWGYNNDKNNGNNSNNTMGI